MSQPPCLLKSVVEASGKRRWLNCRTTRGRGGRILTKLEYLNPGYSKKDGIARQIIEDA